MCLNPIVSTSRVKRLIPQLNQAYAVSFDCGQCAECLKQKQDEWYLRTYYQTLDTFSKGGYVFFDTLTYRNEELPHISEFVNIPEEKSFLNYSCFDTEDYRLFFVRLRRYLTYLGFDVKNNLKYFLTSEYGVSEKGTHRPHYHILFFVTDPNLDVHTLAFNIYKAWGKGHTDSWINKFDANYLNYHTYISDDVGLRRVCNYVSKYVTKDSKFQKEIDNRIKLIFNEIYDDDWSSNSQLVKKQKEVLRQCQQFHRQSKGYGEYALEYIFSHDDMADHLIHTGMMKIQFDEDKVVRFVKMSKYYEMKIFWEQYRYTDNTLHWRLNEYGKSYKAIRLNENIERLTTTYRNWYFNLDPAYQNKVDSILNGRTFKDLANYSLIYKGRVRSSLSHVDSLEHMLSTRFDVDEFLIDQYAMSGPSEVFYNYAVPSDVDVFNRKFVTTRNLGRAEDNYSGTPYQFLRNGYNSLDDISYGDIVEKISNSGYLALRSSSFRDIFTYNQHSAPEFSGFDDILSLMTITNIKVNQQKQFNYDSNEALKKRWKEYRVRFGLK